MCRKCLSLNISITKNINTSQIIEFCKSCERYFQPPKRWESFEWNSKELLAMLLSRVKELKEATLLNSKFIFTEENSKKIQIEVQIEQFIENNKIRGTVKIQFKRHNKQCPDCQNLEANNFWNSVVQLRHKMNSKRTLLFVEQMCKKHRMYDNTIDVKKVKGGYDFYFSEKNNARKFVRFIESIIGCKVTESSQLLSLDTKSNKTKNKNTFSVSVFPFQKDDLILLSDKMAKSKNISKYLVVHKISTKLQLVDPVSCKVLDIPSYFYFNNMNDFQVVMGSKYLSKMTVISVEKNKFINSFQSADIEITKDYNEIIHLRTHIGKNIGEEILGYDIQHSGIQLTDGCDFKFIPIRNICNSINVEIESFESRDLEFKYFLEDLNEDVELQNSFSLLNNKLFI